MKRKSIDTSNCTLIELVNARTGSMLRTGQIVAFILAWGQTRDRLGRDPSIEEYAADWKQARRSAYREQQRFRDAFPRLDNPGPVLDAMGSRKTFDATKLAA